MADQIVLWILSAVYGIFSVICLAEYGRRADRKTKAVYLPSLLFWLGLLGDGIFLAISWLAVQDNEGLGLTVLFGLFVLLGMFLMLGWKNCLILYDKTGFTQQNLLGMRRRFSYDQVTGWCMNSTNPMESTLYAAGKKITFSMISAHSADFFTTVCAGYRRTHGNQNIPEIPALRKDRGRFAAHVYNPGEYLAVLVIILVFVVGCFAWLVIDQWMPIKEQDAAQYTLTFSAWEVEEDQLILTTPQMQERFRIDGYEDHLSRMDHLMTACDGETTFTVWAKRIVPDGKESPFFWVYALASENVVYRTFEDTTACRRAEIPVTLAVCGGMLLFVLAFAGFLYIVGCYPEKFPRWVVYACYKKNAIDF